jgi:hypothetical protein
MTSASSSFYSYAPRLSSLSPPFTIPILIYFDYVLGYELTILKARGHMDSDEGREYLMKKGILHKGEWEAMVKGDRHTSCFYWMNKLVNALKQKKELDDMLATHIILGEISHPKHHSYPFLLLRLAHLCGTNPNLNHIIRLDYSSILQSIPYDFRNNGIACHSQ